MIDTPKVWLACMFAMACTADRPAAIDTDTTDDSDVLEPAPAWTPPDQTGPYAVGATTVRVGPLADPELVFEVWYPANPGPTHTMERYQEGIIGLDSHAFRDAPVDARGGAYPVVVFSHGFGGIRFQSSFLTEHLASHGFVVVAPDHVGSSLVDLQPDAFAANAVLRPGVVADVFDRVVAGAVPELQVQGEQYAVVGHSFGAWTALAVAGGVLDATSANEACAATHRPGCSFFDGQTIEPALLQAHGQPDPRAVVAVAMAPGGWYAFGTEGEGLAHVRAPLILAGTEDGDLPYATEGRPTFEALGDPAWMGTIVGTGHWTFSDVCDIVPILCSGDAAGSADPQVVQAITQRLTVAHVRRHLLGDTRDEAYLTDEGDGGVLRFEASTDPVDTDGDETDLP